VAILWKSEDAGDAAVHSLHSQNIPQSFILNL